MALVSSQVTLLLNRSIFPRISKKKKNNTVAKPLLRVKDLAHTLYERFVLACIPPTSTCLPPLSVLLEKVHRIVSEFKVLIKSSTAELTDLDLPIPKTSECQGRLKPPKGGPKATGPPFFAL